MSNCQIQFHFNKNNIVFQCNRNELIRDIIDIYATKLKLSVDEFYFFYGYEEIDPSLTINQINNKDEEIKIFVYSKKKLSNEDKIQKSNYIKSAKSELPAIVEFTNDYKINLLDKKTGIHKIKLKDYDNSQIIDQSEIKCSKCFNTKKDTHNNKFYYCFECEKNFCTICQSLHQEHKNIVDYSLKYFRCPKHQDQIFISYCFDCKKNLCIICGNQHKAHKTIIFDDLFPEQNNEYIEKIKKLKELVDNIIDSLKKFKNNLDVYVQIIEKIKENLINTNFNYENFKSMKNLIEMSFLKIDIDQILKTKNINEKFQKIMSIYDMMNGKFVKFSENNEISLKIKIEQNEINNNIYFLDNTEGTYNENGKSVKHNHDNLKEMNENYTSLIIDGETLPFKKFFIPTKKGIYSIKLLLKNKLSNCSYMFCECKNIIDIDFSKFNTENVTDMQSMFGGCTGLKSLNLKSFKTEKVTNMRNMFSNCSFLTSLNLSSFNTQKVIDMSGMFQMFQVYSSLTTLNLSNFNTDNVINMNSMFSGCSSLISLKISSFKTENVTSMFQMFCGCKSLMTLDLSSFNTENVTNMKYMFNRCSSLVTLNLSSFNTKNVTTMENMFYNCTSLTTLNLLSFNTKNVLDMKYMFYKCSVLIELNLSSFNTQKVNTMECMFYKCYSLTKLNLSSFNTQNVINMQCMFYKCTSLTEINLTNFNTENVNNMEAMFKGSYSLKNLNLSNFNTQNVNNMIEMFRNCCNLMTLNLSSFNAEKADTKGMFNGCTNLTNLDSYDKNIVGAFNKK